MKQLIFIYIILISSLLYAQNTSMGIDDFIESGLENNSDVKVAMYYKHIATNQKAEAYSYYFPNISLNGSYTKLSEVDDFTLTLPISPVPVTVQEALTNSYNFSVGLKQPLFTGFRISANNDAAENTVKAREYEYLAKMNDSALEIYTAYWNAYRLSKKQEIVKQNVEMVTKLVKDTKNFLENGLVTSNDLLELEVRLADLQSTQLETKNSYKTAVMELKRVSGIDPEKEIEIDFTFSNEDESLSKYYNKANIAQNESVQAVEYTKQAFENNATAARSEYYPQVYAFANYYYSNPNSRIMPVKDEFNSTWDVGVTFSWTWNWGRTKSKANQMEYQSKIAGETSNKIMQKLNISITAAYNNVNTKKEQLAVYEKQVKSATENFRIYQNRYHNQFATATNLVEAETLLLSAKTNKMIAKADYELALVTLKKVAGYAIYRR